MTSSYLLMAEGGREDDAILKSRATSSTTDEHRHDAAFVEEVATACSDMTGASSAPYYPPLEDVLEHTTTHHPHQPASAYASTSSSDTLFTRSLRRTIQLWYARALRPFWKLTMAQILCAVYILILTFSSPPVGLRDAATNNIIDASSMANTAAGLIYINGSYRPIVAMTTWQKTCLGLSRASAFSMYPMLIVVFTTKMKATHSFIHTTPLSMNFGGALTTNAHEFHVHAGAYLAFDVWLHSLFHVLRWHAQKNMILLWTSRAGLSGIIAILAITLVTFPMMYYKDKLNYEIRQGLHFLFYIVAIGLCFHVPISAIPNGGFIAPILGTCIVLYTLDMCYVYFYMCEKIETPTFHVLAPSGVQLTFTASDRFRKAATSTRGGYIYINIPWINDKQWHPFSLFEDPTDSTRQQIFLLRNGNWTNSVHKSLAERDSKRPCWIKGPFPGPYTRASSYDNHILVATGVGITPALATIRAYKSSRCIHLIWATRDNTMLEYFLGRNYFDHNGWTLIYYTGQKSKLLALSAIVESISNNNNNHNTNVRIIYGRPPLPSIIPNIIYGIESKVGRPEQYTNKSKSVVTKILSDYAIELEFDDRCFTPTEKYDMICQLGQDFGFTITTIVQQQKQQQQQHSTSSLSSNMSQVLLLPPTPTPTPNTVPPLIIRRFSSEIAVKHSSSSWADNNIEQEYGDQVVTYEQFAAMRWDSLRTNLLNQSGTDAAWLVPSFNPWDANKEQEHFVKSLDKHVMLNWAVMYCGGSKSVIHDLKGLSIDYKIDVHVDSFAW